MILDSGLWYERMTVFLPNIMIKLSMPHTTAKSSLLMLQSVKVQLPYAIGSRLAKYSAVKNDSSVSCFKPTLKF